MSDALHIYNGWHFLNLQLTWFLLIFFLFLKNTLDSTYNCMSIVIPSFLLRWYVYGQYHTEDQV